MSPGLQSSGQQKGGERGSRLLRSLTFFAHSLRASLSLSCSGNEISLVIFFSSAAIFVISVTTTPPGPPSTWASTSQLMSTSTADPSPFPPRRGDCMPLRNGPCMIIMIPKRRRRRVSLSEAVAAAAVAVRVREVTINSTYHCYLIRTSARPVCLSVCLSPQFCILLPLLVLPKGPTPATT